MPVDPTVLCACHGEPMYRRPDNGLVYCYRHVQARWHRVNAATVGSAAHRRSTAKANPRRVYIIDRYVGLAATPEEAAAMRRGVKASFAAFRHQQKEDRWRFRETASKRG